MDKKTWIVIAAIVAIFGGLVAITSIQNRDETVAVDYGEYDLTEIIPASETSGNLTENVEGDPEAPILIFDYADYQCEGCASMNPYLNKLVEEYDGKVAVVFRGYIQSYHQNGTAAASAANAAAMQGYWSKFKDLMFTNQDEWYSANAADRQKLYEKYFTEASEGKGDLEKFREDMNSKEVAQKITFDRGLADKVGLEWTPSVWLGDELIPREEMGADFLKNMREKIDAELKEIEK